MITKYKLKILTPCIAFLLCTSVQVKADPLKEIFGLMTTSAGPSRYESQQRNGLALGTFSARFSMYQPKVVSFQPPSINAGCGGIDFFGGSMSLIKKEELVQMARNVAAGAAVYAFNLAVESICPSCSQAMNWLQDKLERFNELVSADCQAVVDGLSENKVGAGAAKALKDGVNIGGWHEKLESLADTKTDPQKNWVELLSERSKDGRPSVDSPTDRRFGNLMWNALNDSDIPDWNFASGFDGMEMRELLMSLTGTMILRQKDDENIEYASKKSLLSIQDLVFADEGEKLKIYKCLPTEEPGANGELPCTKFVVSDGSEVAWTGMYNKTYKLLMGDDSSIGLAQKMVVKQDPNPEEKGLISNASVPLMSMLFYLGKDVTAQASISRLASIQISFIYIDRMVENLYKILKIVEMDSKANSQTNKDNIDFIIQSIKEIERQREELQQKYKQELESANSILESFNLLVENVKSLSAPGI